MLTTFARFWDPSITLYFYNEDIPAPPAFPNVVYRPLPSWFIDWKDRHADNKFANGRDLKRNRKTRAYDFRLDCVKFAHKVAALTDIGGEMTDGILIWMDADTLTHAPITSDWVYSINKRNESYIAWLDRQKLYPECGFITFNCWMDCHQQFMDVLRETYRSDAVFKHSQTHDSYVIHQIVLQAIKEGWMPKPCSISGSSANKHHPFVYSMLGDRLDHAKGARKIHGRTLASEVKGKRREGYWKP